MEDADLIRLLNARRGEEYLRGMLASALHRVTVFADVLKIGVDALDFRVKSFAPLRQRRGNLFQSIHKPVPQPAKDAEGNHRSAFDASRQVSEDKRRYTQAT